MFYPLNLTRCLALFALTLHSTSAIETKVRSSFDNLSSPNGAFGGNFVTTAFQGNASLTKASGGNSGTASDGALTLEECSFGQTFSPYTPFESYAGEEVRRIRSSLYPAPGASRSTVDQSITNGGTAFRYLSLLYSNDPGEADVTNHFDQIEEWYGEPERQAIANAILEIRAALANAPLDTSLRSLLLDAYTDRAIAEMQFLKNDLVYLGKKRLGLELVSEFIIDEEIEILEGITEQLEDTLAQYSELFTERVEGVEPSDFDPSATLGTPFGYYIFKSLQPGRNQTRSQYFETDNNLVSVPDYDENTQSVIPNPTNQVLAEGYKDYVTLLTIMGDYISQATALNRLRGLRQLPASSTSASDLELARREVTEILSTTPTDLSLLQNMFADDIFLPGDSSGVNAAITGVETALADLTNVRAFLDGNANLLGLDPNFLILLQTQSASSLVDHNNNPISSANFNGFDSFSQIVSRLRGANRPLTVALEKLEEAKTNYDNFRGSVDQVTEELSDVRVSFEERFREITGYIIGVDDHLWDGINPKPGVGSELEQVALDKELLEKTEKEIDALLNQFDKSEELAKETLNTAEGLNDVVEAALYKYSDSVDDFYLALQISRQISAGSQALTEGVLAAAGADGATALFTGGGAPLASIAAGGLNAVIQTAAAGVDVIAESSIDEASKTFESALQQADNALSVSQAQDSLQDILRERYAAVIEQQEVLNGIRQANAQQKALLLELAHTQQVFESNTADVRSKFYADPIHFVRSQNSILAADAAFQEAQRWMFYAQRALEHKWTQRFGVTSGGLDYDSGSLFKMRNVSELDDLLTAYLAYDANRELGDVSSTITSIISFKDHLLARNPKVSNLTDTTDDGLRVDLSTGFPTVVSQTELFQRKLRSYRDQDGAICIPFNTALLQDIEGLFRGPEYSSSGNINSGGQWRDKIVYIKFNIIADDGPISGPGGFQPLIVNGAASYGGLTIFRTRVVPCPSIDERLNQVGTGASTFNGEFIDYPGEFFVQPYRFYQSQDLNNIFQVLDRNTATGPSFAYSGRTARASGADPTQEDVLGQSFQINDFRELSVAATRWVLKLNANQPNLSGQALDVEKIQDIELIIRHRASSRILPANCP